MCQAKATASPSVPCNACLPCHAFLSLQPALSNSAHHRAFSCAQAASHIAPLAYSTPASAVQSVDASSPNQIRRSSRLSSAQVSLLNARTTPTCMHARTHGTNMHACTHDTNTHVRHHHARTQARAHTNTHGLDACGLSAPHSAPMRWMEPKQRETTVLLQADRPASALASASARSRGLGLSAHAHSSAVPASPDALLLSTLPFESPAWPAAAPEGP
jgi:hypothetical protein